MAQKAQVVLVDDLDGSPATETIAFGLDGRHYQIDLSAPNARRLRSELKTYIRKARTTAPPPAPRSQAADIRRWAQEHGYDVSDRGRIHRNVLQAYGNAARK
jgi:hypothetical protein